MDSYSTIIAHKIRKVREIKGFSQDYIASKLQISQNAYSKLERGEVHITDDKLELISKILEVPPDVIKNYSDNTVFNNCTNSGNHNNYSFTESIEKVESHYQQIINEKDSHIKSLEEQVKFLQKNN